MNAENASRLGKAYKWLHRAGQVYEAGKKGYQAYKKYGKLSSRIYAVTDKSKEFLRNKNTYYNAWVTAALQGKKRKEAPVGETSPMRLGKKFKKSLKKANKTYAKKGRYRNKKAYKKLNKRRGKGRKGPGLVIESSARPEKEITFSINYKKDKRMRAIKDITNVMQVRANATFGNTSPLGLQSVAAQVYLSQNDMLGWITSSGYIWSKNPGAAVISGPVASSVITAGYSSTKYLLQHVQIRQEWLNQSPSPCNMEFIWLVSKVTKEVAIAPITDWQTDITARAHGVATTSYGTTMPGAKPFDIPKSSSIALWRNWKCFKTYKVYLEPGATHIQKFKFGVNRILDPAYINQFQQIKGISIQCMIIQTGTLCDASLTITASDVALSPTKMICSQDTLVRNRYLALMPPNQMYNSYNLDNTNEIKYQQPVGGVGNPEVVYTTVAAPGLIFA